MSVSTSKMQGSESLITDIVVFSWPGVTKKKKDIIILQILRGDTALNWNSITTGPLVVSAGGGKL